MKAVILAAGKGTRLQPLTFHTPKPLLKAGDRHLIDYLLERLVTAGVTEVLINVHHLAEQIQRHIGDGARFGFSRVIWFEEEALLDTGGALRSMLPALGDEPCLVVSADIWTDYPIERLLALDLGMQSLHLMMTPNPPFHAEGDFSFRTADAEAGLLQRGGTRNHNYGGYAVIRPELISRVKETTFPMLRLMELALDEGRCSGELWQGHWFNVGTATELESLNVWLKQSSFKL